MVVPWPLDGSFRLAHRTEFQETLIRTLAEMLMSFRPQTSRMIATCLLCRRTPVVRDRLLHLNSLITMTEEVGYEEK